ncbi:hypothetical protein JX266_013864 [Neoarthrinium moseri]|nr:hypothetical protein JX266_013864 [Neoarthrinium moseri]
MRLMRPIHVLRSCILVVFTSKPAPFRLALLLVQGLRAHEQTAFLPLALIEQIKLQGLSDAGVHPYQPTDSSTTAANDRSSRMAQPPRLASRPSSMLSATTPGLLVGLQPRAASALSRSIPTPRLYEHKTTPIFCNSRLWMDVYQNCGFTFPVDAVIDTAGCPRTLMKCGTFTSLDTANRAMLQVLSEDSCKLMIDRYRTMV